MPIDLYYMCLSPPSRAAYCTARVLGIEINLKMVNLVKCEQKSEEFLKINPNHTIPTLVDNGYVLFESSAIMTYLENRFKPNSKLYPKTDRDRAQVDQMLHFVSSALFHAWKRCVLPKYFGGEVQPEDLEVLREKILVVERLIGTDKKFVTGNSLTLADIALGAIIPSFDLAQAGLTPASVTAYLQRVYQACPQLKEINESSTL